VLNDRILARRRLGRTGFEVSPLGLGGAHLGRTPDGYDDDLAARTVHAALEAGINLIDTAPMYWGSEARVGPALEQWYDDTRRREAIVLSTKTGRDSQGGKDYSAEGTKRSVEASLNHLRADYIDLLLVHDPTDVSEVLAPRGVLAALRELKEQQVIRAIGVGVRSHEIHRCCIESGEFDLCLTFCDFNLLDQSARDGVIEPAARHDVGVLNGTAMMNGLLTGPDPREIASKVGGFGTPGRTERAHEIWQWARARGVGLGALNLQFCMREQRVATSLLGVANPPELEANLRAALAPIPDEIWADLEEYLNAEG
jgi:aryl-alcohol dehydrogenase-like predicted oxidoreductase